MLPLLLLLSAPLFHALHDGDNYCDNGPNHYFCTADCTGYYYCAGAHRGQVQSCAADRCTAHGVHLMPPQLKNVASEMPLVAGSCTSFAAVFTGTALSQPAPPWPGTCWKGGAVDPCEAKSCSGHGICTSAAGCTCTTGWSTGGTKAGIECDVNPNASGEETCPGTLEMMIVIDRSGSVQTTPQDFKGP